MVRPATDAEIAAQTTNVAAASLAPLVSTETNVPATAKPLPKWIVAAAMCTSLAAPAHALTILTATPAGGLGGTVTYTADAAGSLDVITAPVYLGPLVSSAGVLWSTSLFAPFVPGTYATGTTALHTEIGGAREAEIVGLLEHAPTGTPAALAAIQAAIWTIEFQPPGAAVPPALVGQMTMPGVFLPGTHTPLGLEFSTTVDDAAFLADWEYDIDNVDSTWLPAPAGDLVTYQLSVAGESFAALDAVPAPGPLSVLGVGLLGLAWVRRRVG